MLDFPVRSTATARGDACCSPFNKHTEDDQLAEYMQRERGADDDKQCSAQVFKKAGRHFKRPGGRHQKGAGRRALQKRPRQNTDKWFVNRLTAAK